MSQPVAHGSQALDPGIDFVSFCSQQTPVYVRLARWQHHRTDFVQRKTGCLTERNQRQVIEHAAGELSP